MPSSAKTIWFTCAAATIVNVFGVSGLTVRASQNDLFGMSAAIRTDLQVTCSSDNDCQLLGVCEQGRCCKCDPGYVCALHTYACPWPRGIVQMLDVFATTSSV